MKQSAYASYKPSGVEWLDKMPTHWDAAALRWMSRRYSGGTPDKSNDAYWEEGEIPWLNSGAVNDGYITEPSALITQEGFSNSSAKWIPKGALVMALAGQGKTKGMVAQLGFQTTCNQSMAAIIPDHRLESRYLYWWLAANYQNIRNMAGGEARDGLNLDLLGSIQCPLPTVIEQQSIADFLDAQTAQIDTLLAKKRQFIAKLKEKRSALIARTVTRGLPPAAAQAAGVEAHPTMKDSSVEWLGHIPAHWEIKRLRYIGEAIIGLTYAPEDVSDEEDGTLVLRSSNVQAGKITFNDTVYVKKAIPKHLRTRVGDILICSRNGSRALIGKNAMIDERSVGLTFGAFMTIFRSKFSTYLYWVFNSNLFEFQSGAFLTSTINQLTVNNLYNFAIAFPPSNEQQAIAAYLDRETARIDQLTAKVEAAIARLTEYRQALITAAVTGKIDVRNNARIKEVA